MAVTRPARRWAYGDLFKLPDDGKRYEIIEGELYELPPPSEKHQRVSALAIQVILPEVMRLGARWYHAPTGVFMAGADPVQPDLLVLLPDNPAPISERGVEGAPDLVVEILSPSNPKHDRITKRRLYARGGVREYWLVSPEMEVVEVLLLEGDSYRTHVHASGDELVTSTVLPDLSFPASALFG
jgi:Uma2 family endonuclease